MTVNATATLTVVDGTTPKTYVPGYTGCMDSSAEWIPFVMSSMVTFLGGVVVLLFTAMVRILAMSEMSKKRLRIFGHMVEIKWLKKAHGGQCRIADGFVSDEDLQPQKQDWFSYSREIARELVSAQRRSGRLLATCVLICSIGSLVVYIADTYRSKERACLPSRSHKIQQVDYFFNAFFLIFFFIRFVAAYNKLSFWFEMSSLVDFFTVPPSIVALYLNRNWLGFRFLRSIRLINIPDLLVYTGVLRSSRAISICRLCANFVAFLICAAGFVHLIENSGDIFLGFKNGGNVSFFDCLYFMVVTLTTVGYGDIYCKTYTGKAFMVAFLIAGLTFFAMLVPQLSLIFGVDRRFAGAYHSIRGRKHVIVCGVLNFRSLSAVIEDFLHSDREESRDIDVCILNTTYPSIELEALMKRHSPYVNYFVGSAMKREHLGRVLMRTSDACIILVDRETNQPSDADFANIMRVIAIKNYSPRTRILLQLLHYTNKPLVQNIPHWTSLDEVICISELKLGLLSQSCLAFGFSTMMANVFRVTSNDYRESLSSWRNLYCVGASMEIYTCHFSSFFDGKSFRDAALICFNLGVLLLAVESTDGRSKGEVLINPGDRYIIGYEQSRGFVLANSSEEAKRIHWLCNKCHSSSPDSLLIPRGPCVHTFQDCMSDTMSRHSSNLLRHDSENETITSECNVVGSPIVNEIMTATGETELKRCSNLSSRSHEVFQFDSSGLFYRCGIRSIEDCTLNGRLVPGSRFMKALENHVILCLFATADSPSIGLRSFVLPLRASNISVDELHPVILLGDLEYFRKDWEFICNFPEVYIYHGSPNSREAMSNVRMKDSHTCIVMSLTDRDNEDNYLIDKSAILCTLCIRSFAHASETLEEISKREMHMVPSSRHPQSKKIALKILKAPRTVSDLEIETNVQYVQEDNDEDTFELYRTASFASGQAFVDTIIDYIISTAYYNDRALKLVRSLLTGGATDIMEANAPTGRTFDMCDNEEMLSKRYRPRMDLVDFSALKKILHLDKPCVSFGELFCMALSKLEMLCIGIYRLKFLLDFDRSYLRQSPSDPSCLTGFERRIVLTFPSAMLQIHHTDQIYVSRQFTPDSPTI